MADTELRIEIKGLELPEEIVRSLNAEVQTLTLRELAKLDLDGEIKIRIGQGFPLGIVVERP